MRELTEVEIAIFKYLNYLRKKRKDVLSSTEVLKNKFDIDIEFARTCITLWMRNFKEDGNYKYIKLAI